MIHGMEFSIDKSGYLPTDGTVFKDRNGKPIENLVVLDETESDRYRQEWVNRGSITIPKNPKSVNLFLDDMIKEVEKNIDILVNDVKQIANADLYRKRWSSGTPDAKVRIVLISPRIKIPSGSRIGDRRMISYAFGFPNRP